MAEDRLLLHARPTAGGRGWELLAPAVGCYALAPDKGAFKQPGDRAGALVVLQRAFTLIVPDGVAGYVESEPPELRHQPVGFGTPLLRLRADVEAAALAPAAGQSAATAEGHVVVRAPQAGRFWRRADPDAPLFVEAGETLSAGRTLGLLEVMKTFNPVKYTPGGELPETARLKAFLVEDGADVEEGQPLLELEP